MGPHAGGGGGQQQAAAAASAAANSSRLDGREPPCESPSAAAATPAGGQGVVKTPKRKRPSCSTPHSAKENASGRSWLTTLLRHKRAHLHCSDRRFRPGTFTMDAAPEITPSLVLNLFPHGFTLCPYQPNFVPVDALVAASAPHPYDRSSFNLLKAIDNDWLPADLLDDIPGLRYIDGCVVLELRDYRSIVPTASASTTPVDSVEDPWGSKRSATPVVHRLLLRPSMASIVADLDMLAPPDMSYEDRLKAEALMIKAVQQPLCLDASPEVARIAASAHYNKNKLNHGIRQLRRFASAQVHPAVRTPSLPQQPLPPPQAPSPVAPNLPPPTMDVASSPGPGDDTLGRCGTPASSTLLASTLMPPPPPCAPRTPASPITAPADNTMPLDLAAESSMVGADPDEELAMICDFFDFDAPSPSTNAHVDHYLQAAVPASPSIVADKQGHSMPKAASTPQLQPLTPSLVLPASPLPPPASPSIQPPSPALPGPLSPPPSLPSHLVQPRFPQQPWRPAMHPQQSAQQIQQQAPQVQPTTAQQLLHQRQQQLLLQHQGSGPLSPSLPGSPSTRKQQQPKPKAPIPLARHPSAFPPEGSLALARSLMPGPRPANLYEEDVLQRCKLISDLAARYKVHERRVSRPLPPVRAQQHTPSTGEAAEALADAASTAAKQSKPRVVQFRAQQPPIPGRGGPRSRVALFVRARPQDPIIDVILHVSDGTDSGDIAAQNGNRAQRQFLLPALHSTAIAHEYVSQFMRSCEKEGMDLVDDSAAAERVASKPSSDTLDNLQPQQLPPVVVAATQQALAAQQALSMQASARAAAQGSGRTPSGLMPNLANMPGVKHMPTSAQAKKLAQSQPSMLQRAQTALPQPQPPQRPMTPQQLATAAAGAQHVAAAATKATQRKAVAVDAAVHAPQVAAALSMQQQFLRGGTAAGPLSAMPRAAGWPINPPNFTPAQQLSMQPGLVLPIKVPPQPQQQRPITTSAFPIPAGVRPPATAQPSNAPAGRGRPNPGAPSR
eukprot:jgi/Chlat1/9132/Chrsp97S08390